MRLRGDNTNFVPGPQPSIRERTHWRRCPVFTPALELQSQTTAEETQCASDSTGYCIGSAYHISYSIESQQTQSLILQGPTQTQTYSKNEANTLIASDNPHQDPNEIGETTNTTFNGREVDEIQGDTSYAVSMEQNGVSANVDKKLKTVKTATAAGYMTVTELTQPSPMVQNARVLNFVKYSKVCDVTSK